MNRKELTRSAMIRTLMHYPWMTARITIAIYRKALRLLRKR
jgi:DUF1365 family protein